MLKMDIYNDIEKATQIPATCKSAKFIPLKHPGKGIRDRAMNKRNFPRPRNIELIESDSDDSEQYEPPKHLHTEEFLDECRVNSYIKSVNGGLDYSNQFLEHHWKMRQCSNNSTVQDPDNENTLSSDSSTSNTNCSDFDSKKQKFYNSSTLDPDIIDKVFSWSRYFRNALIKGLLKNNMITLADIDLSVPDDMLKEFLENSKNSSTAECLLSNNVYKSDTTSNTTSNYSDKIQSEFDCMKSLHSQDQIFGNNPEEKEDYCKLNLVPHPDDPEFFVHPLQAYGSLDNQGIDFTLNRIGKKTKVTPRQYFINDIDDSAFEFVRKKSQMDSNGSK